MKILHKYIFLLLAISIPFAGCRKEDDDLEDVEIESPKGLVDQGSNDETARYEYDNSIDQIFTALNSTGIGTGRNSSSQGIALPCGVIQLDSSGGVYVFRYDSTVNCGIRKLSGAITASLAQGSGWSDVNARLKLTFINYKVLYIPNNQELEFNGSIFITNRDGGYLYEVLAGKVITHMISGTFQITFDKNDTRTWTISKRRVYESPDKTIADLQFKLEADGSVAESGTTKNGDPFTTTFPDPLVYENCSSTGGIEGPFVAKRGQVVYSSPPNSLTVEPGFVYDASSGNINQVNDCTSEGYKLTYKIFGQTVVKFQPY